MSQSIETTVQQNPFKKYARSSPVSSGSTRLDISVVVRSSAVLGQPLKVLHMSKPEAPGSQTASTGSQTASPSTSAVVSSR